MATAEQMAEEQQQEKGSPAPNSVDDTRSPLSRALVLDNGSQAIKFGYGGDSTPTSELLSVAGRTRYPSGCCSFARSPRETFTGAEALRYQTLLRITWPIEGPRVADWDDVELLWHHVFYNELKVEPEEHPLLMTAPFSLTPKDRERMAILVFEQFMCPAFFASDSAPLSLYSTGRTTGLVVDSGHRRTAAVPVYEGFPLANAAQTFDIAGRDITKYLRSLLSESHSAITDRTDELTARDIKEYCCYIADDPYPVIVNKTWEEQAYTLPDGKTIHIGTERFRAPEPMFTPMIGLPATILRATTKSDVTLREELWRDILLVGGNTLFPGFRDRLQQGLNAIIPYGMKPPNLVTPPDPKLSAWLGGSMLTGLSTFHDMCIQYKEYDEYGPVLMRRKCSGLGV
ncbi:gamma-actin [Parathielavia appendiculata]|uniref:Gamma-actin n=1 Tax=Parathielavia appendiculata TaxID=2587402 RepID=A0AAN6YZL2_9PEZI|nr:gamma-actin [Parathielavia appendiculata]